jgi:coenzyme F420-reducing hydrogenase alpha subunit
LNVIEHLWFRLKEATHRLHPELVILGGSVETKKERLMQAVRDGWEVVREERELIDSLINSIQKRMEAVRVALGGPTRY